MQLAEQYRPQTWDSVVGQDKVVSKIKQLKTRGLGGRAYWISGASGTGKTSIAKLIAAEIADEFNWTEVNSTTLTPAGADRLERNCLTLGMGTKNGKAVLINEAHSLRNETIPVLLDWLERLPLHCCVLFTTTTENEQAMLVDCLDASPLLSRCVELALARRDLARPLAERVRSIAIQHGLDGGQPIERFVKLLQACKNNCRAALQRIDSGELLVA
jgi:DNA polymerase-3 subunit gamma/tau